MNDDDLNKLLLQAREDADLPSSFQRGVWQRIAADKTRLAARWRWFQALLDWLNNPLRAGAACSVALLAGLLVGTIKPPTPTPEVNAAAYAQFINPLAKLSIR